MSSFTQNWPRRIREVRPSQARVSDPDYAPADLQSIGVSANLTITHDCWETRVRAFSTLRHAPNLADPTETERHQFDIPAGSLSFTTKPHEPFRRTRR